MSRKRRSFTTECKAEAARRVIDSGRTIAEVVRELDINEALLGRWVADEHRRMDAAAASGDSRSPPPNAPNSHGSASRYPWRKTSRS